MTALNGIALELKFMFEHGIIDLPTYINLIKKMININKFQ